MTEYHGWATIKGNQNEDSSQSDLDVFNRLAKYSQTIARPQRELNFKFFNGIPMLWVAGSTNHYSSDVIEVIELFRFIASCSNGSYGLLYVWDDENQHGRQNEFQVWRLAMGAFTEHKDPFLSPCIPTIEL